MPAQSKAQQSPLPGTKVNPFLFYADVWNRSSFDQVRMQAYKQMETEGQIRILKITYSKADQMVVIEYRTVMPHEWVLDELRKRVQKAPEQVTFACT